MRALSCATGCLLSLANLDAGRINPEVRYGLSDGCEVVETCIRNVIDDEAGCVRNSGLIRISEAYCYPNGDIFVPWFNAKVGSRDGLVDINRKYITWEKEVVASCLGKRHNLILGALTGGKFSSRLDNGAVGTLSEISWQWFNKWLNKVVRYEWQATFLRFSSASQYRNRHRSHRKSKAA
jgi:hypothetical protein